MKNQYPLVRVGQGQAKHRFLTGDSTKPCVMAGLIFEDSPGFQGVTDGDVIFSALCNAISNLTGIQVSTEIIEDLVSREGIIDSEVYLAEALKLLKKQTITHVSICIEAKRPYFKEFIDGMRKNIARVLDLATKEVGITAITGNGLSDVGCGEGVQCFALITTMEWQ